MRAIGGQVTQVKSLFLPMRLLFLHFFSTMKRCVIKHYHGEGGALLGLICQHIKISDDGFLAAASFQETVLKEFLLAMQ